MVGEFVFSSSLSPLSPLSSLSPHPKNSPPFPIPHSPLPIPKILVLTFYLFRLF
ncbi:hypothetical protein PI95_005055 [Hassallia byssoidea VB512170]|uniref:Uncharacterized protein n=1 Tax=Hassallia byssoidea VB512170 TaxID=1304833 RepID=A0A846H5V4_9CYAN|nr:hypothetical protein [Hassalia byssoidea]NEU71961.1 hypothetical protein [Hassalia byssoidea VB512170]